MNIEALCKNVKVYGKDKYNNIVLIPLSRYSVEELLNKRMVYRIEINSNDISIADIIALTGNNTKSTISILPELIYGEEVDSPKSIGITIIFANSIKFKTQKPLNLSMYFHNQTKLVKICNIEYNYLLNSSSMFAGCSSLVEIPVVDTSNATNMSRMFAYCTSLAKIPALDTSNATDMSGMFARCTSLVKLPALDTSKVTDMSQMFAGCTSLAKLPALDTFKVTDMSQMFAGCSSLKGNLSLHLSSCKEAKSLFEDCINIDELELLETDRINEMSRICYGCKMLKKIQISNTSQVVDFSNAFENCDLLQEVSVMDFSNAVYASNMFYNCKSLKLFKSCNANKLVTIESMFENCENLSDAEIGDYHLIESKNRSFFNCPNLCSEVYMKYDELDKSTCYLKYNVAIDSLGYTYSDNNYIEGLRNLNLRFVKKVNSTGLLNFVFKHKNLKYIEIPQTYIHEFEPLKLKKRCYDHDDVENSTKSASYALDKVLYIDPVICSNESFSYSYVVREEGWGRDREEICETRVSYYVLPKFYGTYFQNTEGVRNRVYDDFIASHGVVKILEDNIFFKSSQRAMIDKVDFYVGDQKVANLTPDKLLLMLKGKKISKIAIKDNFVMIDILFGTDDIEYLPEIEILPNVVSCRGLFSDLIKLKNIGRIVFSSLELEDLTAMFLNCRSLEQIPKLEILNSTVIDYVFCGCESLEKSPEIEWKTSSKELISMHYTFKDCTKLKKISRIELNGRTVNNIKGMLYGCFSLQSFIPLKLSDEAQKTDSYTLFYGLDSNDVEQKIRNENPYDYYKNDYKYKKEYYDRINDIVKGSGNQLIIKMFNHAEQFNIYNFFALEDAVTYASIDDLTPMEYDFEEGVIDGTNSKYGIFVYIPSKQSTGLIHVSKLTKEQRLNLNKFKKDDPILIKIVGERNGKFELDFYP